MSVKVRPFTLTISGVDVADSEADGFIEGGAFVCRFYGLPFLIGTTEIGKDERGDYALIEPTDVDLGDGFLLRIEEEWEEDGDHGCQIYFMRSEIGEWHRIMHEKGVDTSRINVCMPPSQSISVYFDRDGNVNGTGRGGS